MEACHLPLLKVLLQRTEHPPIAAAAPSPPAEEWHELREEVRGVLRGVVFVLPPARAPQSARGKAALLQVRVRVR